MILRGSGFYLFLTIGIRTMMYSLGQQVVRQDLFGHMVDVWETDGKRYESC